MAEDEPLVAPRHRRADDRHHDAERELPGGRAESETGDAEPVPDDEPDRQQTERQEPGPLVLPQRLHVPNPGPQDRERQHDLHDRDHRDQRVEDGVGAGDVEDPGEKTHQREVPVRQTPEDGLLSDVSLALDLNRLLDRNRRAHGVPLTSSEYPPTPCRRH
uniref:Uncharacterized protein n=1 Tax=Streptomyces sp. NBC_00003 TaxID=2903608 RepID=A0AAU2VFF2_9ACTN